MTIGGRREKRELLGLTRRLTMNDWMIDEGCEEAWLATAKLKGTGEITYWDQIRPAYL